jgi:hypothetical protein
MNSRKTDWCLAFTLLILLMGAISARAKIQGSADTQQQVRSRRIHEILQEAKSYEPADAKTRLAFEEIVKRQVNSFVDFEKQCADLQISLAKNDVMEKRKRHMLAELRYQFRDDQKVQQLFKLLTQIDDVSDKTEPIWRGMIACSNILASSTQSKQSEYQTICIDPAHQQLTLLGPEMAKLTRELQDELQKYGATLPPDFLELVRR